MRKTTPNPTARSTRSTPKRGTVTEATVLSILRNRLYELRRASTRHLAALDAAINSTEEVVAIPDTEMKRLFDVTELAKELLEALRGFMEIWGTKAANSNDTRAANRREEIWNKGSAARAKAKQLGLER